MTRLRHWVHLCSGLVLIACGGGGSSGSAGPSPTGGGSAAGSGGGEAQAGGEGTQGTASGDGESGPSPSGQASAGAGAADENPWGAPDAESGRPLPPRRPMSSSARSPYEDAVRAAESGNDEQAKTLFERALSADSNNYKAAYNLGVLADRAGRENDALQFYRRALRVQADYERAAEGIVRIHLRRGNASEALSFIEPLARRWERNLHLQALYSNVLIENTRLEDAVEAARSALRRDERFVPAMTSIVKASLKQGRRELARDVLDQALAVTDADAELHYLNGVMLRDEDGRMREAMAAFTKAVERRPDYVEARMALGIQLLGGANYDQALQHFERVAALAPSLAAAHLNLGDAYRATKQWQRAKQSFDRALRIESQLPEAHFNMGLMYMAAGGDFPGLDIVAAIQKAIDELRLYREQMGARLPRTDPSEGYLADLDRMMEREKRRIEREETRRRRDAERAARQAEQPAEGQQPAPPPAEGAPQ